MADRRTLLVLGLLVQACALTTGGTTGPDDGGVGRDLPLIDASSTTEGGPGPDLPVVELDAVPADSPADATITDPRCPSLPCLQHPILRRSERGMLLARPDGRTFRWGVYSLVHDDGSPLVLRTPATWARIPRETIDVQLGEGYACTLSAFDGGVRCWGTNAFGQLGDGTMTARDAAMPVVQLDRVSGITVASGSFMNWAARDREVWIWGSTWTSPPQRLLVPRREHILDSVIVRMSLTHTGSATAAILDDGSVRVWGLSQRGSLGVAEESSMLPPTRLPLPGPARTVIQFPGGGSALLADGTVHCWGGVRFMVRDPRIDGESLPTPTLVPGVDDLVDLQLGVGFACGLTWRQQVRCWGLNTVYGQLGYGSGREEWVAPPGRIVNLPPVREIAVSSANVCALTLRDEVYCWGQLQGGALGVTRVPATPAGPMRVEFPE